MEKDSKRIAEIIAGLSDINLIGVEENAGEPLRIHIECRGSQPLCPSCEGRVHQNGLRIVELVDLPAFGRNVFIIWHKRRWLCANKECPQPSFSDNDPRIAASRLRLSSTFDESLLVLLGFGQFRPTRFTYVLVDELRIF